MVLPFLTGAIDSGYSWYARLASTMPLLTMKRRRIAVMFTLAFALGSCARAERLRFDSFACGQREIGIFASYGESHRIPSLVTDRARFDQLKLRFGRFISPRAELAGELAAARQNGEPENHGWSASGCARYYLSIRGSTAIACDLSVGFTRFERRLTSQSTRINFTEQLGFALQYATGPRTAVTLEYKFSHNSNAGLKIPNLGVNASIVSLGWSWYP